MLYNYNTSSNVPIIIVCIHSDERKKVIASSCKTYNVIFRENECKRLGFQNKAFFVSLSSDQTLRAFFYLFAFCVSSFYSNFFTILCLALLPKYWKKSISQYWREAYRFMYTDMHTYYFLCKWISILNKLLFMSNLLDLKSTADLPTFRVYYS